MYKHHCRDSAGARGTAGPATGALRQRRSIAWQEGSKMTRPRDGCREGTVPPSLASHPYICCWAATTIWARELSRLQACLCCNNFVVLTAWRGIRDLQTCPSLWRDTSMLSWMCHANCTMDVSRHNEGQELHDGCVMPWMCHEGEFQFYICSIQFVELLNPKLFPFCWNSSVLVPTFSNCINISSYLSVFLRNKPKTNHVLRCLLGRVLGGNFMYLILYF